MRLSAAAAAVLALWAVCGRAQTVTTTDEAGQTVVEAITVDAQGLPLTQTLQTLTPTATTTQAPDDGQQGPVGAPPEQGDGPTIYTYTTTDAGGNTIAVQATFTPTFGPTTAAQNTAPPGTVLDYSSWKASIGTNTVAVVRNGASTRKPFHSSWLAVPAALCAGFTGGLWLALA